MLVNERRERINVQSSSTVELKGVLVDLVGICFEFDLFIFHNALTINCITAYIVTMTNLISSCLKANKSFLILYIYVGLIICRFDKTCKSLGKFVDLFKP